MSNNNVLYINPVGTGEMNEKLDQYLNRFKGCDTKSVDVWNLRRGPHHLEYYYYDSLVAQDILYLVKYAENQGYAGTIIGCFYDPCLIVAREICPHMVVVAPMEASIYLAASLGHRFSILVSERKSIPEMENKLISYGLRDKLASFRNLDMGVLEFQKKPKLAEERMRREAKVAIEEDGAEVLILGCSMEFGFYEQLQDEFKVPVIDSVIASLKYVEYLVEIRDKIGWMPSQIAQYKPPVLEEIREWNLETDYDMGDIWHKKKIK